MSYSKISEKILNVYEPTSASYRYLRDTVFQKKLTPPKFSEWPKSWVHIHFKSYPRLPRTSLPKINKKSAISDHSLAQVLYDRVSTRGFGSQGISLQQISELLFFSAGIKSHAGDDWDFSKRMYPSGGARFPVEIYVAVLNSPDLDKGLYHYHFQTHSLEELWKRDLTEDIAASYGDRWVPTAGIFVFMTAMFGRTEVKYKSRGLRHVFIEAGHIGQNMYLTSTALGLGCCELGGHVDDQVNKILDIDGWSESIVNSVAIGSMPPIEK